MSNVCKVIKVMKPLVHWCVAVSSILSGLIIFFYFESLNDMMTIPVQEDDSDNTGEDET